MYGTRKAQDDLLRDNMRSFLATNLSPRRVPRCTTYTDTSALTSGPSSFLRSSPAHASRLFPRSTADVGVGDRLVSKPTRARSFNMSTASLLPDGAAAVLDRGPMFTRCSPAPARCPVLLINVS